MKNIIISTVIAIASMVAISAAADSFLACPELSSYSIGDVQSVEGKFGVALTGQVGFAGVIVVNAKDESSAKDIATQTIGQAQAQGDAMVIPYQGRNIYVCISPINNNYTNLPKAVVGVMTLPRNFTGKSASSFINSYSMAQAMQMLRLR